MKKHLSRRLIALMLALVLCMGLAAPAGALDLTADGTDVAFEQVSNDVVSRGPSEDLIVTENGNTSNYKATDNVRVSIVLDAPAAIYAASDTMNFAEDAQAVAYREYLEETQDMLAWEISDTLGEELDVVWNLTLAANIISANVQYGDIEDIRAIDGVADVIVEQCYEAQRATVETTDPNMATSSDQIGSSLAWASGYTGAGSRVAVIDTGTDVDHQSFDADAFEYAIAEVRKSGKDIDLMDESDLTDNVLAQLNAWKKAETKPTADELYVNAKIPFGYNYVDGDFDIKHVNDEEGEHGSHVAGIATANRYISDGNGGYEDALDSVHTQGVAPDAQLITMKVFGKGGGAYDSDYMAAIEDAIILGADSINLSLGSSIAGMTGVTAAYQDIMDGLIASGAVVSISAGNNGAWSDNTYLGGLWGLSYLYSDDVNLQTGGSPGTYTNAFTVASVDNVGGTGNYFTASNVDVYYTESTGYGNAALGTLAGKEYDYILIDGYGTETDFAALGDAVNGAIVFVSRGSTSFYEKANAAVAAGAAATIIYNNTTGTIGLNLTGYTGSAPCVSILQSSAAEIKAASTEKTANGYTYYTGKMTVSAAVGSYVSDSDYYTMSSFSSWGIPGSLEMKPEITAPGGNIYSVFGTNKTDSGMAGGTDQYENMSGTSMAAPQIAGMAAVLAQHWREMGVSKVTQRSLSQSLLMSTATPIIEEDSGNYYSILNQGAGLANVNDAINAHSYIMMDEDANAGAIDGKVKVELGDDPDRDGVYTFSYTLYNLTDEDSYYEFSTDVFVQDTFEYYAGELAEYGGIATYLDTWTTPLAGAEVSYAVTGQDFNENGYTQADVQKVLDAVAGARSLTAAEKSKYDLDGDGDITSYDAHLVLEETSVKLPANGYITVTVTIDVTDCDFSDYPNGTYIEAYSYATEFATEEGVAGTVHSIPVLGFYGNWSDPSMYDGDTLAKNYDYVVTGDAESMRTAYLADVTYGLSNYLTVKYPGDNTEYMFFGNPMELGAEVTLPERNAINADSTVNKYYYSQIRNAGNGMWQVTDADTGELYYRSDDLGTQYAAYYYSTAWKYAESSLSLKWDITDMDGNKLEEDTTVDVSLVLAPEYYADENGAYDWDELTDGVLGEGAYFTTRMTIDNTDPELLTLTYNKDAKTITVTAKDNRYLACIDLYERGDKGVTYYLPDQPVADKGKTVEKTFSVANIEEGTELYILLTDYAVNQTTYKFVLGGSTEKVNPTEITVTPDAIELFKGNSQQLSIDFKEWLVNDEVIWESDDETVATVDENGLVTGVGVGETTITVTSRYDESVSATCEVTVKSLDVTITGVLQDVEGQPQLFSWNLGEDETWEKTAELENTINSATYDSMNDVMYQMDGSGYLYKVDVEDGETLDESDSTIAFGAPVDDMEVSHYVNYVHDTEYIFGIYGSYVLYSNGMENSFSYGYDMSSVGVKQFTTISWAGGYSYGGKVYDVFYLTDSDNNIWMFGFNAAAGGALNFNGDAPMYIDGFAGTWDGEDGALYCSMVNDGDDNLYLSYFNGDTNEIYVLTYDEVKDSWSATLLGDVGDKVWPCALLSVTPNDDDDETDSTGALREITMDADCVVMEAEAEQLMLDTDDEADGGLNAVAVERGNESENLGSGRRTVTLDVVADDSTNGVVEVAYDRDAMTFQSARGANGVLVSAEDDNGTVTLAYAARTAHSGKAVTLTFVYNRNTSPENTDVTVTTLEECDNFTAEEPYEITLKLRTPVSTGTATTPSTPDEPDEPDTPDTPVAEHPFTDVKTSEWYNDDIAFVYEEGLMSGVSETEFAPNATLTRGMLVTILYRLADAKSTANAAFTDVDAEQWYAEAVAWAAANGIVDGMGNGIFAPNAAITREQIATILYRYAVYCGLDVSVGQDTNILSYGDATEVSAYAVSAMQWACGAGLINGSDGMLMPRAEASRAQIAAIIHRFCNLLG